MYSKVKLAGHPLHPMLVAFPVALYTSALACFIACAATGDPFWFRAGWIANFAGVCSAGVAALPGFIDWAFGVPARTPAKRTGFLHMLANLGALGFFAANLVLVRGELGSARPELGVAIPLAAAGVVLTAVAGFLGWKMVQTHHVGVDLSPEQERFEPRPGRPVEPDAPVRAGPTHTPIG
jgi:uncharacterized membrane protein